MGGTIAHRTAAGRGSRSPGRAASPRSRRRRARSAAKPATSAGPVAWKRCSGPPAGTWKARPAGIVGDAGADDERQLAIDDEAPVRLDAGLLERGARRSRARDLGQRRRPSSRASRSGWRRHPDGRPGGRRARHAFGSSLDVDAVVGLGVRSIAGYRRNSTAELICVCNLAPGLRAPARGRRWWTM